MGPNWYTGSGLGLSNSGSPKNQSQHTGHRILRLQTAWTCLKSTVSTRFLRGDSCAVYTPGRISKRGFPRIYASGNHQSVTSPFKVRPLDYLGKKLSPFTTPIHEQLQEIGFALIEIFKISGLACCRWTRGIATVPVQSPTAQSLTGAFWINLAFIL